jgi:hypothetical protein
MATRAADEDAATHAGRVLRAADAAVGGVVPQEAYQQLALDYSAWRVRALQDEELLGRALDALDRAAEGEDAAQLRGGAFAAAVEIRALLDARRDATADDDEPR